MVREVIYEYTITLLHYISLFSETLFKQFRLFFH